MTKIFKRSTLVEGVKAKKTEKNRLRNNLLNFRVTAEERALIENRISLSGLSKIEYFTQSCLNQEIHTTGNIRTFNEIKRRMEEIDSHLCSIEKSEELDLEILESLRTILEILDSIYGTEMMLP